MSWFYGDVGRSEGSPWGDSGGRNSYSGGSSYQRSMISTNMVLVDQSFDCDDDEIHRLAMKAYNPEYYEHTRMIGAYEKNIQIVEALGNNPNADRSEWSEEAFPKGLKLFVSAWQNETNLILSVINDACNVAENKSNYGMNLTEVWWRRQQKLNMEHFQALRHEWRPTLEDVEQAHSEARSEVWGDEVEIHDVDSFYNQVKRKLDLVNEKEYLPDREGWIKWWRKGTPNWNGVTSEGEIFWSKHTQKITNMTACRKAGKPYPKVVAKKGPANGPAATHKNREAMVAGMQRYQSNRMLVRFEGWSYLDKALRNRIPYGKMDDAAKAAALKLAAWIDAGN